MAKNQDAWWDPSSHKSGGYLEGKRGFIRDAEFTRDNYNGKGKDRTVLTFRLEIPGIPDDKQPYPVKIGMGDTFWPSLDGKTKEVTGPRLVNVKGRALDKKTQFHSFQLTLAAAKFPVRKFAEEGASALNGAEMSFSYTSKTFKIEGEQTETEWLVVDEFFGFEGEAGSSSPAEEPVDESALLAELAGSLTTALQENNGEIPRGQVSIRLNKTLKDNPNRTRLLTMATKDEYLGQVEGITFDRKAIKLSE